MRVLQLIDSLDPGGAERMAVNLANAWSEKGHQAFLVATRKSGGLEEEIMPGVGFFILNKKGALDFGAVRRLINFIREKDIEVLHAHSSSFFTAYLVKVWCKNLKLIWQDHYGLSEQLVDRNYKILRFCSKKFDAIISVNDLLKDWALVKLKCDRVEQMDNFVWVNPNSGNGLILDYPDTFQIICLANFRPQKDHLNLLKAFEKVASEMEDVSLHLVGELHSDEYEQQIRDFLGQRELKVKLYGPQKQVHSLLKQADLGVLSSMSEGLPLALLEYGMAGLPVVTTNVGQCKEVVGNYGALVPPADPEALGQAILDSTRRISVGEFSGKPYSEHIMSRYSFDSIYSQLKSIYRG